MVKEMHPALIAALSALVTGFLLILAMFIESWAWKRDVRFHLRVPTLGMGIWNIVLSSILVLAILGALGMFGYTIAAQYVGEKFTEFYLLDLSGEAEDYPRMLMLGAERKVVVGIINREGEAATYWVEVKIDGIVNNELGPVTLEHNGKWEEVVAFIPDRAGDEQKVEFLLYRQGQSEVYQRLYLTVDVQ